MWWYSSPSTPLARWFSVVHIAALLLPALLLSKPSLQPPIRLLRELYPVLWLSSFWAELSLRPPLGATPPNDAAIAAIDARLFGVHWNEIWMTSMPNTWFSEFMHGAYFSYYLLLVGVPLLLLLRRCRATLREVVLRMSVTYLACFVIYAAFPVRGPFDLAHPVIVSVEHGWFHGLVQQVRGAGDALGTAFPSSHTAGAVTFAVILWRLASPQAAWLGTVAAACIALATVYTRNHFPVDTLAGLCIALVAQFSVVPLLTRQRTLAGSTPVAAVSARTA